MYIWILRILTHLFWFLFLLLIFPSLFLLLMNVIIHQQVHVSYSFFLIYIIDYYYCNSSELFYFFFYYNAITTQSTFNLTLMTWEVCNNPQFLCSYNPQKGLRDELITNWFELKFIQSTKVELKISVWCLIANLNLFSMCFRFWMDAFVMHKKMGAFRWIFYCIFPGVNRFLWNML